MNHVLHNSHAFDSGPRRLLRELSGPSMYRLFAASRPRRMSRPVISPLTGSPRLAPHCGERGVCHRQICGETASRRPAYLTSTRNIPLSPARETLLHQLLWSNNTQTIPGSRASKASLVSKASYTTVSSRELFPPASTGPSTVLSRTRSSPPRKAMRTMSP